MIEYQRDLPKDTPPDAVAAEAEHVRVHLAAIADADDDPATHIADVRVWTANHPDDPNMIRIEGVLDADPVAPYLAPDYDPFADVDPELRAAVLGG